jgi:hypothetical protein
MSDNAEAVALRLLELLMQHEQVATEFKEKAGPAARIWLLHSYGECLRAVVSGKERAETRIGRERGRDRGGGMEAGEGGAGKGRRRKGPPVLPLSED